MIKLVIYALYGFLTFYLPGKVGSYGLFHLMICFLFVFANDLLEDFARKERQKILFGICSISGILMAIRVLCCADVAIPDGMMYLGYLIIIGVTFFKFRVYWLKYKK